MTKKITKVAIHDGRFHADEAFAIAVLKMLGPVEYVRTRNQSELSDSDLRVDVGGKNNPSTGDFDHHQPEGAGQRENGIPYAAFGLIWKHFGQEITGSAELAERVDRDLVQMIDAADNGMDLFTPKIEGIKPFSVDGALDTIFMPSWEDDSKPDDINKAFGKAVDFASQVLKAEIHKSRSQLNAVNVIREAIKNTEDKRLLILNTYTPWKETVITEAPDVLFVTQPAWPTQNGNWVLSAVNVRLGSFKNRKDLPASWAGKKDDEFVSTTGVKGALFCHKARFMAVASSKQACLDLAKLALDAPENI